jgi:hypothetical protein
VGHAVQRASVVEGKSRPHSRKGATRQARQAHCAYCLIPVNELLTFAGAIVLKDLRGALVADGREPVQMSSVIYGTPVQCVAAHWLHDGPGTARSAAAMRRALQVLTQELNRIGLPTHTRPGDRRPEEMYLFSQICGERGLLGGPVAMLLLLGTQCFRDPAAPRRLPLAPSS